MANIKSAEKRIRQTAKRQATNRAVRSRLRGTLKSHRAAEPAEQAKRVPETYSEIDVALRKGVIHKNAAARLKSRLAKKAARTAQKKG
jgi:small subunit ribosomal protein S20